MSEKKKTNQGPPQKSTTRAPAPTSPIRGGSYVPSPSEIVKNLPKETIPGIPRWIYGSRLMACAELTKSELTDFLDKRLLKAYKWDDTVYNRHFDFESFENLRFPLLDVLELEEEGVLFLDDNLNDIQRWRELYRGAKQGKSDKKNRAFPCEPGTRWEDITIILVADDTVRIKTPNAEGPFTYHELRMNDKRSGDRPTMVWELLKLFAKSEGFISSQSNRYDSKLPDTAKRLNKHLKQLFGIDRSIYRGHYKKENGYRTRITFHDQTFGPHE